MNISDKDFASIFAKTLKGSKSNVQAIKIDEPEDKKEETPFVFLLNRLSGGVKSYILSLHPYKGYLLPHMQSVTWPKLKGWIDFSSAVFNNTLYLMGGKEKESGKYTGKVLKYDPAEDRWTHMNSMKKAKAFFSVDVIGSKLLITGGETSGGEILDTIESYEPMNDTWVLEGNLPEPRKNHVTAIIDGRIYICGGQSPGSAFNSNLWELKRERSVVDGNETYEHQWCSDLDQALNRKIQQSVLFPLDGKLYCVGGLVQGPTEDGKRLADEMDIDEPNSDSDAEHDEKNKKDSLPYVPTYLKLLEESSKQKKRKQRNLTRTSRRMLSFDISNEYLRQKNPSKIVTIEKRLLQARASASTLRLGNRVYLIGGYRLEDDSMYVPTVEYYHVKKRRWFRAFDISTYDNESFRNVHAHVLNIPNINKNFKVLTPAYKYPLW